MFQNNENNTKPFNLINELLIKKEKVDQAKDEKIKRKKTVKVLSYYIFIIQGKILGTCELL